MMSERDDPPSQNLATTSAASPATTFTAMPRSRLARELETLPPDQLRVIGLGPSILLLLDVVVAVAHIVVDDRDPRPLSERFDWLEELTDHLDATEELDEFLQRLTAMPEIEVDRWGKRMTDDGWQLFAKRFLGAARYDRLAKAYRADAAAVTALLRWLNEKVQPFAVAFDDLMAYVPEKKVRTLLGQSGDGATSVVRGLLALDSVLTGLIEVDFDLRAMDARPVETAGDLSQLIADLRTLAAGPTRTLLNEMSTRLSNKLIGARQAMETSVDGVSQAACSLTELIDRLMRQAFPNEIVMGWIERSPCRKLKDLTYRKNDDPANELLPTKRATALCFIYGGRIVDEPSPFHDAAATAVVEMRFQLERLKHADSGDPAEKEGIARLAFGVEAFLTLAIRIGWFALEADQLQEIRARLAA